LGDLVYLDEYRGEVLDNEIVELKRELQLIMSAWPDKDCSGYFLSLEEMEQVEKKWLEERKRK
jgi:hypothetical protein